MPRQRTYARIRIETFERHIGLHTAKKDHTAVEALRYLARDMRVELSETHIQMHALLVTAELNRRQIEAKSTSVDQH